MNETITSKHGNADAVIPPRKFAAAIHGVHEVSLIGSADLNFWHEFLSPFGHCPFNDAERAQIRICGAGARFMGMAFREVSISVALEQTGGHQSPGAFFLLHAFNSNRFFAFVERAWFSTPYYAANVNVEAQLAAQIHVAGGTTTLDFQMAAAADRQPESTGEECWQGPVYLPPSSSNKPRCRWFFAKLAGYGERSCFLADQDEFTIHPGLDCPAIQQLVNSDFSLHHILIRPAGFHAKGKTITSPR